ncbi:hypothetical protein SADFL11_5273 [Roseibium alexandrii DFL-11]|uniref:HNH nuclease domain-containing protein n=2 Tax=Roseibium alexandrii TaxID=388408 RepID=A0A5E8H720_ROSAD|nr:hypothetical protein SADFL11_5273 [Roseibium alexandrii DFL-11]
MSKLLDFLRHKMSMTDVYQPVIIKELLQHDGQRTKAQLAATLAAHDASVQRYYEKIVMRWPKQTLTKHGVVGYDKSTATFQLVQLPEQAEVIREAIGVCDKKIVEWLEKKKKKGDAATVSSSARYEVLKAAHGKCELCGISSDISPIDVDHIVPQSKADKNGKVRLHDELMGVNDKRNLQALCFACNRAKRDTDATDFRRRNKLVRDRIPELIREEGRTAIINTVSCKEHTDALMEKLVEEHAELIAARTTKDKLEELVDLAEVVFSLAKQHGADEATFMQQVRDKRAERGGFNEGYVYKGDVTT